MTDGIATGVFVLSYTASAITGRRCRRPQLRRCPGACLAHRIRSACHRSAAFPPACWSMCSSILPLHVLDTAEIRQAVAREKDTSRRDRTSTTPGRWRSRPPSRGTTRVEPPGRRPGSKPSSRPAAAPPAAWRLASPVVSDRTMLAGERSGRFGAILFWCRRSFSLSLRLATRRNNWRTASRRAPDRGAPPDRNAPLQFSVGLRCQVATLEPNAALRAPNSRFASPLDARAMRPRSRLDRDRLKPRLAAARTPMKSRVFAGWHDERVGTAARAVGGAHE